MWSTEKIPDQSGRLFLVTGANSGIGFETTKVLLNKNAKVIMGCRSLEKGEIAKKYLMGSTNSGVIELLKIDLADLREVDKSIEKIISKYPHLDVLINNAGIMATPRTLTKQNLELQFAVNHLSHMALTQGLLPLLASKEDSRVVTVTSSAQYLGKIAWDDLQGEESYDRWSAYSQSKLANVMFGLELESKLRESNSQTISVLAHPGLAQTNLQSKSVAANGSWQEAFVYKLMAPLFQDASMGALPQLLAATSPDVKGGQYYGPRFNFKGYPKLCKVAKFALSEKNRKRLWEESHKLIHKCRS